MYGQFSTSVESRNISLDSYFILVGDSWLTRKRKARLADKYGDIDGSIGKRGLWLYLFNGWKV